MPRQRPATSSHDRGAPAPSGTFRRLLWLVGGAALTMALLAGVGAIGVLPNWFPHFSNPFEERTTDRSQPVLLQSIQDLSRYTAASGNFEVVIDVENDRRFIPDFIAGERILFVAAGNVDAYVEFGGLAGEALVLDEAANAVEVTLPTPELAPPNLDQERSYVYATQRGAADRIGDFFGDNTEQMQQILVLAEDRIAEAAQASELRQRAEENTRAMLTGMLSSLGFASVTVRFMAA